MTKLRSGRQKYYNIFSHFYDLFIRLHARDSRDETRRFLVDSAGLEGSAHQAVLDVCCGTGSAILSFTERFSDILAIGYDFSSGMLRRARQKDPSGRVIFVEGDAGSLSFADNSFDIVCCSHALYELKGEVRNSALQEMKRVVKSGGRVLVMEHEAPQRPLTRFLFSIRMMTMGATGSGEFLKGGINPFEDIFADVTSSTTASGKSKLLICRKS